MNKAAAAVLNHLVLEQAADGSFITVHENEGHRRVFGGQLMAQALLAATEAAKVSATRTVPAEKQLASFQTMFLSSAKLSEPIKYSVEGLREGSSLSMLRVTGSQSDRACFSATIALRVKGTALATDAQVPAPVLPGPDDCASFRDMALAYQKFYPDHLPGFDPASSLPPQSVEMRFVDIDSFIAPSSVAPEQAVWIRFSADVGKDQATHNQVLAYASDQAIAHVVAQLGGMGGLNPNLSLVSASHGMWFHDSFRVDEWLLMVRRCRSISGGWAAISGEFFDGAGTLVAGMSQNALIRM